MSAGTLTLTNNSDIVTGIGTSFATELAAGDFVVVTVGGVPYTLPVKSVESDTGLTLVSVFTGPTQSGAAWSAVPRVALNMVTAALVAQSAEALRGLNYDKQNWQQVYSASGNITVKLPDGSTYSGPSWKYLSDNMATKSGGAVPVNQGGTGSTTEEGARTNLGLGSSATKNIGTVAGTVAAGDDNRLLTINNKSGGTVDGSIYATAGSDIGLKNSANVNGIKIWNNAATISPGAFVGYLQATWFDGGLTLGPVRGDSTDVRAVQLYVGSDGSGSSFNFFPDGRAVGNWQPVSDIRVKSLLETIPEPLVAMESMRGYSWFYENTQTQGFGFVASEARTYFPGAIKNNNMTYELPDGEKIENVESVDTYGIAAALHHEAILAIMGQVQELKAEIAKLKGQ